MDGPGRVFAGAPESSGAGGARWNRWWKLGAVAIGRPELRFHDLRHLFCTNLARAGVPLADRAHIAGHSQVMALRYSNHCPANSSEAAIEAMIRSESKRKLSGS